TAGLVLDRDREDQILVLLEDRRPGLLISRQTHPDQPLIGPGGIRELWIFRRVEGSHGPQQADRWRLFQKSSSTFVTGRVPAASSWVGSDRDQERSLLTVTQCVEDLGGPGRPRDRSA